MDRRLVGVLLVVAVLLVAIVVPLLGGHRRTGTAQPAPIPRDPRMGDCLREQPSGIAPASSRPDKSGSAVIGKTPTAVASPLGPILVSCQSSSVAAEVVLVVTAAGGLETRGHRVAETGIDCHAAALRYAGLTGSAEGFRPAGVPAEQAARDPVAWRMSINLRTTWLYPSAFQQSSGRAWAACVVAPPSDGPYRGSLAGAMDTGRLPDEYGTCWNASTVTPAVETVDCRQPHPSELLSAGVIADRSTVTTADLRQSCRRLAAAAVGRLDPTAGGRLVLKTTPERLSGSGLDRSVSVLCYLSSADRPLAGTLIGLHERPVPFDG